VIALAEGGVRETVEDGVTGCFFDDPTPHALAQAVRGFDTLAVDPAACVANARRFDVAVFRRELRRVVAEAYADERPPRSDRRRTRPRGLVALQSAS